MLSKTKIELTDEEVTSLNEVALKYEGGSEFDIPNILIDFPSVLEKVNANIDAYLPSSYVKYMTQSWSVNIKPGKKSQVNLHNHGYTHFSFVFYTTANQGCPLVLMDMNNLTFRVDVDFGDFIILPNYYQHQIEPNVVTENRICFAGDIIVTEHEHENSTYLPPIHNWCRL